MSIRLPIGVTEDDLREPGTPGMPKGPEKLPAFTALPDLANEKQGGEALWTSDDFFAAMDNLVKQKPAEWVAGLMTERGKWMDGWESRRHNKKGVDTCILRLGLRGAVKGVCVDTSHYSGNHAPEIEVDAICVPDETDLEQLLADDAKWTTVVPKSRCRGCFYNYFEATELTTETVSHIRLKMYPDGGIARFRVYGEVRPNFGPSEGALDLARVDNGGLVVGVSDAHFSSKDNIIGRGFGVSMQDGWETKRSRTLNHSEWLAIRLGHEGWLKHIEVDTRHFKGNFPDFCQIDGVHDPKLFAINDPVELKKVDWTKLEWQPIVAKAPLHAHRRHFFAGERILAKGPWTHVRITIFPDGGVSRLRVVGHLEDPNK